MTEVNRKNRAIIMVAGASSRFVPHCFEYPKALLQFRGERLVERQINQLIAAGIEEIYLVVGYKGKQFEYLRSIPQVDLIENPEYDERNNHSTLYYAREHLENCFICAGDNYYVENPFLDSPAHSIYASTYVEGRTDEWCLTTDTEGLITDITIGGRDAWVMMGHAYFDQTFGKKFREILCSVYDDPATKSQFWEDIYFQHVTELPLYIQKLPAGSIYEFDSFAELLAIEPSFAQNPRSKILSLLAHELGGSISEIIQLKPIKQGTVAVGFRFAFRDSRYRFILSTDQAGGVCMLEPDGSSGGVCFNLNWSEYGI